MKEEKYRKLYSLLKEAENLGGLVVEGDVSRNEMALLTRQLAEAQVHLRKSVDLVIKTLGDNHPANSPCGILGPISLAKIPEPIHTRLIAWFLDPNGTHGFGVTMIRALLQFADSTFQHADISDVIVIPEALLGSDPDEYDRIDIKVTGKTNNRTWNLYLEAKLNSREGVEQLARYEKSISKVYSYPIYLTPYGAAPKTSRNGNWIAMSYADLVKTLWGTAKEQQNAPGYSVMRLYLSSLIKDVLDIPWTLQTGAPATYQVLGLAR